MTLRRLIASAALTLGLVVATGAPAATAGLRVSGNQLVDGRGRGHVVQLRGVNRSGLEYACIQGWGFFDSPHPERIDDAAMIRAMLSWDINVVRDPAQRGLLAGVQHGGEARRNAVPTDRRALRRRTAPRRPVRDPRPALGRARRLQGDRADAHGRRRPHARVLAVGRVSLQERSRGSVRPLQRAVRDRLELLAARVPRPAGQRLPGVSHRRDAAARQRGALDRCDPAVDARRDRLLR